MEQGSLTEQLVQMHFLRWKELAYLSGSVFVQGEDALLLFLNHFRRPVLAGELADKLGLTSGRVANILKRLEEKDQIRRMQDGEDRRRVFVSLTETGKALSDEKYQNLVRQHHDLLEFLGEENARELLRLLECCVEYCHLSHGI